MHSLPCKPLLLSVFKKEKSMLPSFIADSGLSVFKRASSRKCLLANRMNSLSSSSGLHSDFFFFPLFMNTQVFSLQGRTGLGFFWAGSKNNILPIPVLMQASLRIPVVLGTQWEVHVQTGALENQTVPVVGDIPFTFEQSLSFTRMKVYTLSGLRKQSLRIKQTWI